MTNSPEIKNSSDAFRLIHQALARWIGGALEDGFEDSPIDLKTGLHWCDEFILMAERMRDIEAHTDICETRQFALRTGDGDE